MSEYFLQNSVRVAEKKRHCNGSYPSEVAGGLEVDEVVLGWVQRTVPVAIVGVIITHCERRGLRQTAGSQLSCVVMWSPFGLSLVVGIWSRETVHGTQLPPLHMTGPILFHHHYLVGTGTGQCGP